MDGRELDEGIRMAVCQRKLGYVVVHSWGRKGSDEQLFSTRVLMRHEERLSEPECIIRII